jgi:hypothetical protein
MSNIFADNHIYPNEGKINLHFQEFYDSVFVAFMPFIEMEGKKMIHSNPSQSIQLTPEEARKDLQFLEDAPLLNARIYSQNMDYPKEEEIYEHGKPISWETIKKGAGFSDFSQINKALETSIGALKSAFSKPELCDQLTTYTTKQNYWHPTEGEFNTLSKVAIYKAFKLLDKHKICVIDKFYERRSILDLDTLTIHDFVREIGRYDYYLYSVDKELLFTIDWDSFFFLIASSQEKMNQIIEAKLVEGFLCDENTEHEWDMDQKENSTMANMDQLLKNKNTSSEPLTICISLVLFLLFQFNQDYLQFKFWFFYGAQLHVPSAYLLSYPSIIILTFFIYKKSKIAWWIIVSMGTYFMLHFGWNYIKDLQLPEIDQHQNSLETLLTLFEEPRFGLFYYLSNMLVCFVPIYFCIRFKAHFSITKKILWSAFIVSIVLFTLDVLFI